MRLPQLTAYVSPYGRLDIRVCHSGKVIYSGPNDRRAAAEACAAYWRRVGVP